MKYLRWCLKRGKLLHPSNTTRFFLGRDFLNKSSGEMDSMDQQASLQRFIGDFFLVSVKHCSQLMLCCFLREAVCSS